LTGWSTDLANEVQARNEKEMLGDISKCSLNRAKISRKKTQT